MRSLPIMRVWIRCSTLRRGGIIKVILSGSVPLSAARVFSMLAAKYELYEKLSQRFGCTLNIDKQYNDRLIGDTARASLLPALSDAARQSIYLLR